MRFVMRKNALVAVSLFASLAASGCVAESLEFEDETVESGSFEISSGGGATVSSEPASPTDGLYPEVMHTTSTIGGCTATVLGPYAVLTARHCVDQGRAVSIEWDIDAYAVANRFDNPYLDEPYRLPWWTAENDKQIASGGRTTDWPAMHDHVLYFVPSLTPEVLAAYEMTPPLLRPNRVVSQYEIVGGRTLGTRQFAPVGFVDAEPGCLFKCWPRDGYQTLDGNFGESEDGDSGSPVYGYKDFFFGPNLTQYRVKHLVSTTQNPVDRAPVAYTANMTVNQRETVRVNSLWLQARRDDIDGDGIPAACDSDPSSGVGSTNTCPAPVGIPRGADTAGNPSGALTCDPGYVAVGVRGRAGALIDRLGLKCAAISCFSGAAGCDTYWTDEFGGSGGSAFERSCDAGSVLVGVNAREENRRLQDPAERITGLTFRCQDFASVAAGSSSNSRFLASVGGAAFFPGVNTGAYCGPFEVVTGFEARTNDLRFVTGLAPICSDQASEYLDYKGGAGGHAEAPTCPEGTVAIGTTQRADKGVVGYVGLLCADRDTVAAGKSPKSGDITFVGPEGNNLPARSVSYPRFAQSLPANMITKWCPIGRAIHRLTLRSGALVDRIESMSCKQVSGPSFGPVSIQVGGTGGTQTTSQCPTGTFVDGLYTRTGALVDGLALHCR
jgi:hypothetical protein